MRRVRRIQSETRIELTPMIDVVFLLLTFFVFAMVLMVRADVLGVSLPELTAGESAPRVEPITVTLLSDGSLALMGEAMTSEAFVDALIAARDERPDAPVLLAADTSADAGALIQLADRLVGAGITQFSVMGRRGAEGGEAPVEGGAP